MNNSENGASGANGRGNRELPPFASTRLVREIQSSNFIIVINNWSVEQKKITLDYFKKYCKKYILGEEIGELGTPHLQGAFILKSKDRFTGIFNKLGFKCHLEKMKSKNWKDQQVYCSKGENVIHFSEDCDDDELDCITEDMFYPWQKDIMKIIKEKPDNRTIHWIWEKKGMSGKTGFCRYLGIHHNACIIQKGKYADIMNHVFNTKNLRIFLIDVPRSSGASVSYNAIESIKSGIIFNSKFETGQKFINSPHIFIFANKPPEIEKLSKDRWNIVNIGNDDEENETDDIEY